MLLQTTTTLTTDKAPPHEATPTGVYFACEAGTWLAKQVLGLRSKYLEEQGQALAA